MAIAVIEQAASQMKQPFSPQTTLLCTYKKCRLQAMLMIVLFGFPLTFVMDKQKGQEHTKEDQFKQPAQPTYHDCAVQQVGYRQYYPYCLARAALLGKVEMEIFWQMLHAWATLSGSISTPGGRHFFPQPHEALCSTTCSWIARACLSIFSCRPCKSLGMCYPTHPLCICHWCATSSRLLLAVGGHLPLSKDGVLQADLARLHQLLQLLRSFALRVPRRPRVPDALLGCLQCTGQQAGTRYRLCNLWERPDRPCVGMGEPMDAVSAMKHGVYELGA